MNYITILDSGKSFIVDGKRYYTPCKFSLTKNPKKIVDILKRSNIRIYKINQEQTIKSGSIDRNKNSRSLMLSLQIKG